jgi:LPXTG-motif cell wall-anchored protein
VDSGHPLGRLVTSAAAILLGGLASAALIAPSPAAAAELPDLVLTITVTPAKATYAVGDAVTTTFVIKNVGGAKAVNARIDGGDEEGLDRKTDPPSAHHDLEPGQSLGVNWAGTVDKSAAVAGQASGGWTATNDAGEANEADNSAQYHLKVPGATGVLHVKVFEDVKGDYDGSQPGVAGATVVIQDETRSKTVGTVKTDANGYFSTTLAAGSYWLTAPGWKLEGGKYAGHVQVKGGQQAEATLPLVAGSNTGGGTSSPSAPAGSSSPATPGGAGPTLPTTGAGAGPAILIGAAAILFGAVAVFLVRRRRNRFILPG